ncbi:MAG: NnrS family protein [Pseudomonadota bacterium]|nr:MAG: NnrS family protein [Pseudomonadota bacterium]
MQPLKIEEIRKPPPGGFALFALGFRPFFLGASFAAVVLVAMWLVVYLGGFAIGYYPAPFNWHGHEMIFGYTVAVIAGFLLTAVGNWTNCVTAQGKTLALLFALWLAGRLAPLVSGVVPPWMVALVDLAFLPLLTVVLAIPLLRNRQPHNLVFIPVLGLFFVADLLVHLDVLGVATGWGPRGLDLGLNLTLLLITIMGGRVIPFFTERGVQDFAARRWRVVEVLAVASVIGLLLGDVFGAPSVLTGALAVLAAAAHAARQAGWYTHRLWRVPLVWVLHTGYAWMIAGFALKALAAVGVVAAGFAVHAFTTGAIGALTLGMMARVSLGHTGRAMQSARAVNIAFAAVVAAALLRVVAPLLVPQWYVALVTFSGGIWVLAFVLFAVVYAPILIRPRVDGRPG